MILAIFIKSTPIFQTWGMLSVLFIAYFKHFGHNFKVSSLFSMIQCENNYFLLTKNLYFLDDFQICSGTV